MIYHYIPWIVPVPPTKPEACTAARQPSTHTVNQLHYTAGAGMLLKSVVERRT